MALTWLREMLGNWSRTERNKINDNWKDIETKYSGVLKTSGDAKKASEAAVQTANTAKQVAEGIDGKVMEAMSTADVAETKSDNAIEIANEAKTTSENVQDQFHQVVAEAGSNNPEVVASRMDAETGETFVSLSQRLDQQHKKLTAQLDQTALKTDVAKLENEKASKEEVNLLATDKADLNYVNSMMSSITDGSPKELFYSIGALTAKYPSGANGPMLVFDSSFTDGAHAFIWNGTSWVDTGLYQAAGIKDNDVTNTKLSDDVYFKGFPFAKASNPSVLLRKSILDVKIYNADESKRYSIGVLQKNINSDTITKRYQIILYEITSGNFGTIASTFLKNNYTPLSVIETVMLTGTLKAEITINWAELPDETNLTGMVYSVAGLHPLTYLNHVDYNGVIDNRMLFWEEVLTTADKEWKV